MKRIILVFLFLAINLFQVHAQNKLSTTPVSWSISKICVTRNVENFVQMLEMSSSEFESEMKRIGTKVSLGQDYCIIASEQFGLEASINDPLLIFEKCDDQLNATWISNSQSSISPFIDFMTIIKNYYKETKNGIKVYEIPDHNKYYQFAFLRDKKGNTWYENLRVMRLIIKK